MSVKGTLRLAMVGRYPREVSVHLWHHCQDHTYHVDVCLLRWEWTWPVPAAIARMVSRG